jgi:hypothetical protein
MQNFNNADSSSCSSTQYSTVITLNDTGAKGTFYTNTSTFLLERKILI